MNPQNARCDNKDRQSDYLTARNPTYHKRDCHKNYELPHTFMAIHVKIMEVVWIFTPNSVLLCLLQRFGGTYCFHLQGD